MFDSSKQTKLIGILLALAIVHAFSLCLFGQSRSVPQANRIHCVTDISHEFTFYFDGRFGRNYVGENGINVQNWGTLSKYDFANANLLILQSSASPCKYTRKDITAVRRFVYDGGGVLVLGDYATFRDEKQYQLNALAKRFKAEFVNQKANKPLKGSSFLSDKKIDSYSPKTIKLAPQSGWQVLITDAKGFSVLARRRIGKGMIIVASRALCGHRPDASDPINADWWKPLLVELSAGKPVDPKRRPRTQMPENQTDRDRLPIQYSDYMKPYADAIYGVYDRCFPVIEKVMGVPPSKGMLTKLILLPTGGGGFSSGSAIGLAAWWGNFPEKKYGMVELISHESTHSWVHPFTEPMWNEGIATYIGILVGMEMGLEKDAAATLEGWIKGAKRYDPDMTKCDLANGKGLPHSVRMAKPMWIFEQLRKEKPDIVARYFQTKRKLASPDNIKKYTADDSVAVLSIAMGKDLFPWFQSLGVTVKKENAQIKIKKLTADPQTP